MATIGWSERAVTTSRYWFVVIVLAGLVLAGCRSAYDPSPTLQTPTSLIGTDDKPIRYVDAIRYTEALMVTYREAMVDDSLLGDRLAAALIPLGAAALGLGISGVSGNPITALGVASATGFGLGTWFQNRARRDVFGVGSEAAHCVIVASKPLAVAHLREPRIKGAADRVEKAIDAVEKALQPFAGDPADEVVKNAERAVEEARNALRSAADVSAQLQLAGPMVVSAAEGVRIRVARAAVATARDLRDVREHIATSVQGAFRDIVGQPAQAEKAAKAAEGATQSAPSLRAGMEKHRERLNAELRRLGHAADALRQELSGVNFTRLDRSFARCLDPIGELRAPTRLQVAPDLVELQPGGKTTVRISGGTPPYVIQRFPRTARIAYTGSLSSDPAEVEITVGQGVAAGEYELVVHDSGNALGSAIQIDVKAPSTSGAAATNVDAATKSIEAELNKPERLSALVPQPAAGAKWKATPGATEAVFQLQFAADTGAKAEENLKKGLTNLKDVKVDRPEDSPNTVEVHVPAKLLEDFGRLVRLNQWPQSGN